MTVLKIIKALTISCLLTVVIACSPPKVSYETISDIPIFKLRHPAPNTHTSGQPSKDELAQLAQLGVQHIINLRPVNEMDWNEQQYVESLGMSYHLLPITGADNITPKNAAALMATLKKVGNETTLLHCASSNRVGGLIALNAGIMGGKNIEEAVQEGKRWGLTRLENVVRQQLLAHQARQSLAH